jgi:hypothetical protein
MDQSAVYQKVLASIPQWTGCMRSWPVRLHPLWRNAHPDKVYSYAGYANSVIGSIVANQGFINQYGTVRDPATGKLALNATHIALWGAVYFVTCIMIQVIAPTTADRFGRKFNMWCITVFITTVRLIATLHISTLTGEVYHHSVLLQDLVGDSYRTVDRWMCRWVNGHILHGLHVRDRPSPIPWRATSGFLHGIRSGTSLSGNRIEGSPG